MNDKNLNLNIVYVNINELKPAEYNPRTNSEKQGEDLKTSLKNFDIVEPIVVNSALDRKNIIIGGHFRWGMAKELGYEKIPVVYINIPNIEKEKELNLRLNRNQGEWDWEILKQYDMDELLKVGFDEIDLGKYWDNEITVEDDHFHIEKVKKQALENPISKLGDIFKCGDHKVICGDCTEINVVRALVRESLIHYINCDPPFNINLDYSKGVGNNGNYGGKEKDNRTIDDYRKFLNASIVNALAVSQTDIHVFYWCDERNVWLLQQLYNELGIENKRLCIWIKNNQSVTLKVAFNKMTEYAVYGIRGKPYLNDSIRNLNEIQNKEITSGNRSADDIMDMLNIWLVDRLPSSQYQHPTMKPPTLYEKALRRCTKPGDFVLDLFGGSGSQLIACEQLKRKALIVELDPVFVDVILLRYEQFTGVKPTKIN